MAKFWKPPVIRHTEKNHDEHRHVTWLELFYDLAFVVAIAVIGHELTKNTSVAGFFEFLAFFVPVWWAWLGDAFYNNRYDPEDHGHQVLTIVQMFGIIGIAIFASIGLEDGYVGFVISYVIVRFILSILTFRVGKHNPHTKKLTYYLSTNTAIAACIWILSIFVPPPLRYVFMALAILVDVLGPFFNAAGQRSVRLNPSHITQRFGFFVIIMLGEVLAAVVRSVNTIGPSVRQLTIGAMAIGLSFCIWWIYFENDYGPKVIRNFFKSTAKRSVVAAYLWTYAHLPLSMGIMAMAVGIEQIIIHGPNAELSPERVMLLSFGAIAVILSIGAMQISAMQHEDIKRCGMEHFKMVLPFLSSIVILTLAMTTKTLNPLVFLFSLSLLCIAQVLLQEVLEHKVHAKHNHE